MIKGTITSKKGFYVGDPCYVLSNDNYDGVFGAAGYKCAQYTGTNKAGEKLDFIMANTAWGDGCYSDNFGNIYGVDAGIIGVVPIELCEDRGSLEPILSNEKNGIDMLNALGHYFPGTKAEFSSADGVYEIVIDGTTISIDTNEDDWGDEEDEEEEEYFEDDEDDDDYKW